MSSEPAATLSQRAQRLREQAGAAVRSPHYKWIVLSNTTIGVLIASINGSILLIALPDIFRGVHINPLAPGNTSLLLWLMMGYLVVTAVLVVSFGRLGDMYGRVRMYNAGFAVFTIFSILLSVTWMHGTAGALWLIIMRILQGVGGALLMANSSAIITDAFPVHQRGLGLGLNQVAGIAGSFVGLILGGVLAPLEWHAVFLVSVPFGIFGTVWAYWKLHDTGTRTPAKLDWWGNVTFAIGLVALLVGITYGIQPYAGKSMGWTNPWVLAALIGGAIFLVIFCLVETKVAEPMFRLGLFRIRAFTAGNLASLLSALGRGGLQFILIIWLQGIWLPRHGYDFSSTPLWAGIYMLPITLGFLVAGPVSGWLSDRLGARPFATGGMLIAALSFAWLLVMPVNFSYWEFAPALLLNGLGMGLFASPNRAAIMNSLPPSQRGVGSGMSTTFQNAASVLSIGIFFSLMISGLASSLPHALSSGLTAQGVPAQVANQLAGLPPVATLFASLLGYNPLQMLLGPAVLGALPPSHAAYLTGREYFPSLISAPFSDGLAVAFWFAIVACVIAAIASLMRGGKYVHTEPEEAAALEMAAESVTASEPVAAQQLVAPGQRHAAAGAASTARNDTRHTGTSPRRPSHRPAREASGGTPGRGKS